MVLQSYAQENHENKWYHYILVAWAQLVFLSEEKMNERKSVYSKMASIFGRRLKPINKKEL